MTAQPTPSFGHLTLHHDSFLPRGGAPWAATTRHPCWALPHPPPGLESHRLLPPAILLRCTWVQGPSQQGTSARYLSALASLLALSSTPMLWLTATPSPPTHAHAPPVLFPKNHADNPPCPRLVPDTGPTYLYFPPTLMIIIITTSFPPTSHTLPLRLSDPPRLASTAAPPQVHTIAHLQ